VNNPVPESPQFIAIVLAGDRTNNDPVATDAGVSCKAIAPICGKPMILRVLDALEGSELVKSIVLSGPSQASINDCPDLRQRIQQANISWVPNLDSPSKSVESALEKVSDDEHVLLTTADHALLQSEIVDYFLSKSMYSKADACVGLVEYKVIVDNLPEVKRTVIKLRGGGVCGCNLFTFMSVKGRKLIPFWRQVEQSRKRPARMIAGILGASGVLMYLIGLLSLDKALTKISRRLQIEVKAVLLPYAHAGVDVDTAEDRRLVENILANSENRFIG
jgi:GTP:adenosylcobinamide-phosphate guanylyltransferase